MMLRKWLLLWLLPLCASAAQDAPVTVNMDPVRVGKHSWYAQGLPGAASAANQGFMSNAGFVVTGAGVVVFDALGTPPLAAELVKRIRRITTAPIRYVIVSHYHADHIYGLQVFKAAGAEIWAHEDARHYLNSPELKARLAQRREELFPWVDEHTHVLPADRWLGGDIDFELGGVHFSVRHVGPAHTPEDLALYVHEDRVLYAGDVVFKGRVPFVGDADSRAWLAALDKLLAFPARVLVPGHGALSRDPRADLTLTRDYLGFLRRTMGQAVAEMVPFEQAYARTDWSRWQKLPAFNEANRVNAYNNTYLLMEKEALGQ
ncbi:MBL fold metallo-hydrolase [Thiobacter aerophilum]|uniref:MBL fold metallo-hydrolase n=1 Tax=Thiobacter aerophilum TaxID=3121275 RepID=A0ABV0EH25_9BURK